MTFLRRGQWFGVSQHQKSPPPFQERGFWKQPRRGLSTIEQWLAFQRLSNGCCSHCCAKWRRFLAWGCGCPETVETSFRDLHLLGGNIQCFAVLGLPIKPTIGRRTHNQYWCAKRCSHEDIFQKQQLTGPSHLNDPYINQLLTIRLLGIGEWACNITRRNGTRQNHKPFIGHPALVAPKAIR